MKCYPIQVIEIKGLIHYIGSEKEKYRKIYRLIEQLEADFNLPEGLLVPARSSRCGKPRLYKGVNLAEIRRALIVYASLELNVSCTQFRNWFGFDHSNFIKAARKGKEFLEVKDAIFMQQYDMICELAKETELKIAV
jgi:hypothetical protein